MTQETSENLSADIFRTLKERIVFWKYPPGHRFTEVELCEEFGVSRTPVREVLRMLVENGLVDKQANKGYSVKQPDLLEIAELYDVRLALELYVVERLAQKGMQADVWKKLNTHWHDLLEAMPGDITEVVVREVVLKDEAFHETLVLCTENQTLMQYLRSLAERIHFVRLFDITTPERYKLTCEQHLALLDQIKAGHIKEARAMVQLNIESGRANIEKAIKEALIRSYMGS